MVLVFDTGICAGWADAAIRLLDADERERAARYRFSELRDRYVLSHAIWRVALGLCTSGSASGIRIEPTPLGQPRLPDSEFSTSLSHSGPWAAVAVARTAAMGVDIESPTSLERMDELSSFMCAPGERAWLGTLEGPERRYAALRLWTRKEAILKARGEGLARPPNRLDATGDRHEADHDRGTSGAMLRVRDLEGLPGGLTGALAASAEWTVLRLHVLDESAWRMACAADARNLQMDDHDERHEQGAAAWDVAERAASPGARL